MRKNRLALSIAAMVGGFAGVASRQGGGFLPTALIDHELIALIPYYRDQHTPVPKPETFTPSPSRLRRMRRETRPARYFKPS